METIRQSAAISAPRFILETSPRRGPLNHLNRAYADCPSVRLAFNWSGWIVTIGVDYEIKLLSGIFVQINHTFVPVLKIIVYKIKLDIGNSK